MDNSSKSYKEHIQQILKPMLPNTTMKRATEQELQQFKTVALKNHVPEKVIVELSSFYAVINNSEEYDILIHKINDPLFYEFWSTKQQLWIGQKDMDLLSWKNGKYHIGAASRLNYGESYQFDSFIQLLRKGSNNWFN